MPIFKLTKDELTPLTETRFDHEGFYERRDLQRLLRKGIDTLDSDVMVITDEFGAFTESSRRIDLLCLDRNANLVVVELKRTDDGGHMELQAVRYAAMVSAMTFEQVVDAYANAHGEADAEDSCSTILRFLGWSEPHEDAFNREVRIILAAADFSKELTTSVLWLNTHGIDIRCIRMKPYQAGDGPIMLEVQQLIPLPEAADYQTRIKHKEAAERQDRSGARERRMSFWTKLLNYATTRTPLHAQRSATGATWIGGSSGRSGFGLNYVVREADCRVELYIDLGPGKENETLNAFEQLAAQKAQIDASFGEALDWQPLPERRACRICKPLAGGWQSPPEAWPEIHVRMVDAMIKLDAAVRPPIAQLRP